VELLYKSWVKAKSANQKLEERVASLKKEVEGASNIRTDRIL
jgi:hypothetical protein